MGPLCQSLPWIGLKKIVLNLFLLVVPTITWNDADDEEIRLRYIRCWQEVMKVQSSRDFSPRPNTSEWTHHPNTSVYPSEPADQFGYFHAILAPDLTPQNEPSSSEPTSHIRMDPLPHNTQLDSFVPQSTKLKRGYDVSWNAADDEITITIRCRPNTSEWTHHLTASKWTHLYPSQPNLKEVMMFHEMLLMMR